MTSYSIDEIEGIGPAYRARLAAADIVTTGHLLARCCDRRGRREVAAATGVSGKLLLAWANLADLMRIRGIGPQYSELLEASGVDTVRELARRKAEHLVSRMREVNGARRLTRLVPGEEMVAGWIEAARATPPRITH